MLDYKLSFFAASPLEVLSDRWKEVKWKMETNGMLQPKDLDPRLDERLIGHDSICSLPLCWGLDPRTPMSDSFERA